MKTWLPAKRSFQRILKGGIAERLEQAFHRPLPDEARPHGLVPELAT